MKKEKKVNTKKKFLLAITKEKDRKVGTKQKIIGTFTSCDKQETLFEQSATLAPADTIEEPSTALRAATASPQYYSTPGVGGYTPNSSSSTPLKGHNDNIYEGGVIRAQVIEQRESSFTVRVSKQDGSTFSSNCYIKIHAGSLFGGLAGGMKIMKGTSFADLVINATFAQGYTHFYPTVYSINNQTWYYAEPILIYTLPMYNKKSTYTLREELGTANGVRIRASGTYLEGGERDVQCTEFCSRYYREVYKTNIVNTGKNGGNANTWYNAASAKGLIKIPNGLEAPRPGDILCMSGGKSGLGHVAIIMEVGGNYIKLAQQNGGMNWYPIGHQLEYNSRTKKVSSPSSTYEIQGFLRLPTY